MLGATIAGLACAAWLLAPEKVPRQVVRLAIELPADQAVDAGIVSPDGTTVVYVGYGDSRSRLFLRALDSFEAAAIPGTDGAFEPFFSVVGDRVGFFADGELRSIALGDGRVETLAEAPVGTAGATWEADGSLIVGSPITGGLVRIAPGGSRSR